MVRENIVEEVIKILHGPIDGIGEVLEKNPLDFYSVGVLFPQLKKSADYEDSKSDAYDKEDAYEENKDENNNEEDESVGMRRRRSNMESEETGDTEELELTTKFRPSAAGLSVLIAKNATVNISVKFAIYFKELREKSIIKDGNTEIVKTYVYKHIPHERTLSIIKGKLDPNGLNYKEEGGVIYVDLHESAHLTIITRNYPSKKDDLEIKTFTLINKNVSNSFGQQKKAENCIFQPELSVINDEGFSAFEDMINLETLSNEDINLKLLYRNYKVFGQGHGISVNWNNQGGKVSHVFTQVLPRENVNGVDLNPPVFGKANVLYIKRLSGSVIDLNYNWKSIKTELQEFINLYGRWITTQKKVIKTGDIKDNSLLQGQAENNLNQCERLYQRMLNGINILDVNIEARKAFEDANRAMFIQRVLADFSNHRRNEGRVQQNDTLYDDSLPDYNLIPYNAASAKIWKHGKLNIGANSHDDSKPLAKWRPFQLAFLLSQIEGITDNSSADRDTVDLIWFPTGGGKTEAYLGLTAFTIFYRRLTEKKISGDPDKGAGVTVLMRYTLRLLNKQQFERASILICACDLIRRQETSNYGQVRISNGIWMGSSMTPNNQQDQINDYQNYIQNINACRQPDSFRFSPPLLSCPCCGNRLIKEITNNNVVGRWGYFRAKNNRNVGTGPYHISCTNTKCDFHVTNNKLRINEQNTLPIYEVDDIIYERRPSLLFSTVDKFVQLAWKNESFNIFNIAFSNGKVERLYPSPDLIIQDELHLISSSLGTIYGVYEIVINTLCLEAGGSISKIVGASATVRNAEEQSKRLYGRSYFLQFPPPAIDADDSFYSVKIKELDPKNRLYVGFMPSGVTTSTALIRLTSVLLERIPTIVQPNEDVDNYYTLVVYFNALKELGKFRTFVTDDIVSYRKLLANHFNTFFKPFKYESLCELSSVMTADDITKGLDRLEKETLPKGLPSIDTLVKKLFETGIRTISDILIAKGTVWNGILNKEFFDQIGLTFLDDNRKNYETFVNAVKKLFNAQSIPIQIAPATNMISVGVDIPRLNTMIIQGQPKTAAEYIQASSRVGREKPGVVFSFLTPTKNRDRSHYEQFKAFHQAYYYYVESNSVTPFSRSALEKVLPTVLIALTRSIYLTGNNGVFKSNGQKYHEFVTDILEDIKARGIKIYSNKQKNEISQIIETIKKNFFNNLNSQAHERRLANYKDFMEWDPISARMVSTITNPQAVYNAPAQFVENLLHDHVPTLQTLRNVESSSKISIKTG